MRGWWKARADFENFALCRKRWQSRRDISGSKARYETDRSRELTVFASGANTRQPWSRVWEKTRRARRRGTSFGHKSPHKIPRVIRVCVIIVKNSVNCNEVRGGRAGGHGKSASRGLRRRVRFGDVNATPFINAPFPAAKATYPFNTVRKLKRRVPCRGLSKYKPRAAVTRRKEGFRRTRLPYTKRKDRIITRPDTFWRVFFFLVLCPYNDNYVINVITLLPSPHPPYSRSLTNIRGATLLTPTHTHTRVGARARAQSSLSHSVVQ